VEIILCTAVELRAGARKSGGQASQSGVSSAGMRNEGAGIDLKLALGREKFWTVNFGTVSLGSRMAGGEIFFSTVCPSL
jgi:hypothetical protein